MRMLLTAVLIAFAGAAHAQQKVVFGLVSPPGVGHAPLFIAKELGYWADEGIDVQVVQFNGTAVLLPQIINKSVDVGFPNPDPLVLSRQPGKDPLPLKFFFNFIRANVWEFAVLADSPVKSLADLKGKKIGVGALTFGNIPLTRAMFKEMGLTAGKDYEFVPTGLGAPAFLALREGRVDALNLFDTMHTTLELQGTAIRRLPMPQKYVELFSNGLIAHEDAVRERSGKLVGFGRVVAKGMVACDANRPACVRAFWKAYPDKKPAGDDAKAMARDRAQLDARFDKYIAFPAGQPNRWGSFPPGSWENVVQAMLDGGQIQTKDFDIGALYTNALVPAINDFNAAEVVKAAKALK